MINVFSAPTETRMHNSLTLIKTFKSNVFVKYDDVTTQGGIYVLKFKSVFVDNLDQLFDQSNNLMV
jgi:hypothetical protein